MKKLYTFALILLTLLVASCVKSIDPPSSSAYYTASNRHYQLAHGGVEATAEEWLLLIDEFQGIINANLTGEWADDAQYAIASCWIWLAENRDAAHTKNAIDAFNTLLQRYPNSPRAAEAYYWLGYCHDQLGDNTRAISFYQTVIRRYLAHPISEEAQLQLGRAYERQGYVTSALATYQFLVQRGKNPQRVVDAKKQIAALQPKVTEPAEDVTTPSQNETPTISVSTPENPPTPPVEPKKQPTVIFPPPTPSKEQEVAKLPLPLKKPKANIERKPASPTQNAQPEVPNIPSPHPSAELSLAQQLGLNVRTIVIDPGHGGKDPGALSQTWLQEKMVVLNVSKHLRDILVKKGYKVKLTRETDAYLPLRARTRFAAKHNADLFISIHANASTNRKASGIETYYLALASDESAKLTAARENAESGYSIEELDELVPKILKASKRTESRRLAESVQKQMIHKTQTKNRGIKHAPFVVLIGTQVPAILVEIGFLTHPAELKKLTVKTYQHQLAESIASGIDEYVTTLPLTTAGTNK